MRIQDGKFYKNHLHPPTVKIKLSRTNTLLRYFPVVGMLLLWWVSCIPSPVKVSTVSVNTNFLIAVRLLVNILEMFSQIKSSKMLMAHVHARFFLFYITGFQYTSFHSSLCAHMFRL